jgi:hypothetical protein
MKNEDRLTWSGSLNKYSVNPRTFPRHSAHFPSENMFSSKRASATLALDGIFCGAK